MSLVFHEQVPLATCTTLKVGGNARWFVEVSSVEEAKAAARFAKQNALPLFVLGGGSNLLVSDRGFAGVVMRVVMRGVQYVPQVDGSVQATVGAGEVLDTFIADTVARGYWGLENLSHIPGTVGATPVQNVGAYGVEVAGCIVSVTTVHLPTGAERVFTNNECQFGYRDSFFKTAAGKEYVITAVTFRLFKAAQPQLMYRDLAQRFLASAPTQAEVRAAIIAIRAEKFPDWTQVGTAGSFFKNPIVTAIEAERLRTVYPELPMYEVDGGCVKCSLGYILDKICGLRGYSEGNIALYERQALVLVARRGATTKEVIAFAEKIAARVYERTSIAVEWEVQCV